ncbi:MAG: dTMP kinase [Bacilli bacterium]|jgi:dTMP kinase
MFITLEGPEGSGKTTIAKRIIEVLEKQDYPVIYTREPGGSVIAEQIRKIILRKKNVAMDPLTEALLFAASRRQHLVEKILPALKRGKIVICDRFIDSSLAYQGYARAIGIDKVMDINLFATEGKLPDLTIYFDISSQDGLARIDGDSKREINRLDLERLDFHNKVREGYLELLRRYPKRIVKVDAAQSIEKVTEAVLNIIIERIKR